MSGSRDTSTNLQTSFSWSNSHLMNRWWFLTGITLILTQITSDTRNGRQSRQSDVRFSRYHHELRISFSESNPHLMNRWWFLTGITLILTQITSDTRNGRQSRQSDAGFSRYPHELRISFSESNPHLMNRSWFLTGITLILTQITSDTRNGRQSRQSITFEISSTNCEFHSLSPILISWTDDGSDWNHADSHSNNVRHHKLQTKSSIWCQVSRYHHELRISFSESNPHLMNRWWFLTGITLILTPMTSDTRNCRQSRQSDARFSRYSHELQTSFSGSNPHLMNRWWFLTGITLILTQITSDTRNGRQSRQSDVRFSRYHHELRISFSESNPHLMNRWWFLTGITLILTPTMSDTINCRQSRQSDVRFSRYHHELRISFSESNPHLMNRWWFLDRITLILTPTMSDTINCRQSRQSDDRFSRYFHELQTSFSWSNSHLMNRSWFLTGITLILTQITSDTRNGRQSRQSDVRFSRYHHELRISFSESNPHLMNRSWFLAGITLILTPTMSDTINCRQSRQSDARFSRYPPRTANFILWVQSSSHEPMMVSDWNHADSHSNNVRH